MRRIHLNVLLIIAPVLLAHPTLGAQLPRTRSPGSTDAPPAQSGVPRDPRFPYAGLWSGIRTMPVGSDDIRFKFSVSDGKYSGAIILPNGALAPDNNLVATAAGLTWEQQNSGGGTWVYRVRLVGPDSMVGSLVLRDAPPQFNPIPTGTLVLTRQGANAHVSREH